jgi:hypothetical protein
MATPRIAVSPQPGQRSSPNRNSQAKPAAAPPGDTQQDAPGHAGRDKEPFGIHGRHPIIILVKRKGPRISMPEWNSRA